MSEQQPPWMGSKEKSELTAVPILQILSGIYASKTLGSAVELELFTKLADSGATFEEVARMLDLELRPAEMLVSGCAALGLLEQRDGRFYNSALSKKYLISGNPESFGPIILMANQRVYEPWLRLTEALRTNHALTWDNGAGLFQTLASDSDQQRLFIQGMHAISLQSGIAMAQAIDLSHYRLLLDVGGGSGAYCIEAARHCPTLRSILFDLPSALEVARQKIADAGLTDRIETIAGDFFQEELPKGSDLILLSMILHDWPPEKNRMILRKCFHALEPGGTVIIAELMMDDDKSGPLSAAMMSLCMLIDTEGRNYTWNEYTAWLEEVGFTGIQRLQIHSPGANGLLVGSKL